MAKEKELRLSPEHGLNPTISKCFLCGKDKNEIILMGQLEDDQEAPRSVILNMEPCHRCAEMMDHGVILISVDQSKTPPGAKTEELYRSDGWCVLVEDAIQRLSGVLSPEQIQAMLKYRVGFLADEVWDGLGLPRPNDPPAEGAIAVGHWTVNGVCACESPHTADVLYIDDDGNAKPTVCHTTYAQYLKMAEAVRMKHGGDLTCEWVAGPCKKEGARNVSPEEG